MKKIYVASDHAGFEIKSTLVAYLRDIGYSVQDMGPIEMDPNDDYPDTIAPLARAIKEDAAAFGIVVGGSGQGEAIVCNRTVGVRAAVYYGGNKDIVKLSREHNDANVLSLGARFMTHDEAKEVAHLWLTTDFTKEERHARRIAKIDHA